MPSPLAILRVPLIGSLIVSLSLSGLCISPAMARPAVRSKPVQTRHCCCGTKDGRCCGMACCVKHATRDTGSAPLGKTESSERELTTLAVLRLAADRFHLGGEVTASLISAFSWGDSFTPTLQLAHVRIQT